MAIEFGVLGPLSKETADDRNDGSPDSKINQFSNHNIKVDTVKCFSEIDSTHVGIVKSSISMRLCEVELPLTLPNCLESNLDEMSARIH